MAEKTRIK